MIDIYRGSSVVISVHPSDSDKVTKKVVGENTLSLTFSLAAPFFFRVGDYCFFAGERYVLNILPKEAKVSSNLFSYDLLFEGIEYDLRKVRYLFYTQSMAYVGGADFSLMGSAELHARIIVENLNRVQSGWSLGSVISTDAKNLTFSGSSCLDALTKIAGEFDTEYWIGADKTINVGKRGDILPILFEYGKGKGLYSIDRNNVSSKDIVTRLYAFGSSQNLPKGYRNNAKRLQLSASCVESNVSNYGLIESSETFEDIKPERTGTISAVGDIFNFVDLSMDFDLNEKDQNGQTLYLIAGTKAKIHFQTGALAGYEFEVSNYVHATKTFTLIKFTNEVAYDLPNPTLKPAVGDTYILLDIYMPQNYVDAAEARLLVKATESINQSSVPNVSYSAKVDPLFIANIGITLVAGDYVAIKDADLGIDRNIRLVSTVRNVFDPNKYDIELADTVEPSLTSQILTSLERTDLVLQMNKLLDPARARRNWRTAEELRGAIYDVDGYFDPENIKPFSIETSMLTVGSKSTQFYVDCFFQANYQGGKNNLLVGAGTLAHFTIAEEIKMWTITGLSETFTDDNLRYIYITCLKAGTTGQVTTSATVKPIEEGNYYNFFAGVLSSVNDGARQISLLFGFTTVNGRFVKTGRIQSGSGACYFDLDSEEIGGNIKFKSGNEYKDVGAGINEAVNNIKIGGLNVFRYGQDYDSMFGHMYDNGGGLIRDTVKLWNGRPTIGSLTSNGVCLNTGDIRIKADTEYTISWMARTDTAQTGSDDGILHVQSWTAEETGGYHMETNIALDVTLEANKWKRLWKTFKTPPSPNLTFFRLYLYAFAGTMNIAEIQLEEGNKVSPWKPNAEDVAAAIAIAQTAAYEVLIAVENMGEDGLITPVEKKSLSQLVDSINAEFNQLFNQAENYSDSGPIDDAKNALLSFAGPFLTDMTSTEAVSRTTLNMLFDDYYSAKADLLAEVSSTINGTASDATIIARAMTSGKMLNRDPNFNTGVNGISLYNNSGGTALVVSRNAALSDSPNYPGGFDLKLSYVGGSSGTRPGLGGFTFATQSRANAVFLVRIIAYIPVGYSIEWDSNAIGDGRTRKWLTTQNGEGKFTEYICLVKCGSSGSFSSTNFFYITGPVAVMNWRLCFATVYDTTSSESYEIAAAAKTSIDGGIITSGVIKLGAVDGSIKAGISGSGTSDDSVRFWAGAEYDNRALAPFRVLQSGEVFARKRIELLDENNVGLAGICGSNTSGDGIIRFYAGASYANRATAPFRVDKNGAVVMTKVQLSSSTSGRRVVIDSGNQIKFYCSDNLESFSVTEQSWVELVNEVWITTYRPKIQLRSFVGGTLRESILLRSDMFQIKNDITGAFTNIGSSEITLPYAYMPTTAGRSGLKTLFIDNTGTVCI